MELVDLVVRQDVGLQLRSPREGVAVDLQHLVQRHGVFGRVKVADIGHQKLERVAHPAVGVHHAGQNLVVDVEVT